MYMTTVEFILISITTGAVSGLGYYFINNQYVLDLPKREETGIYLGFIAHMLIGALAALAAVTVIIPDVESYKATIGVSILAAMSGESFLLRNALQTERRKNQNLNELDKKLEEEIK